METLRNVNEVSLNFNLREPRKVNGSTNVYAVVKVEGKQIKLPICAKVYAWQWDAKKQVPRITNNMTPQDIANAMQLNCVLNEVRTNFFSYICSGEPITESTLREHLKITHIMANKNAIPPFTRRSVTASKLLRQSFSRKYGTEDNPKKVTPSSWRTNNVYLTNFLEYLKDNAYDSVNTLSKKGIYDYREYMEQGKRNSTYIMRNCNFIISLVNEIADNPNCDKYHIAPLKPFPNEKVVKAEDEKKRALTPQEVNAIMECDKYDQKQKVVRDMFVMQLNSGVRVSDLAKLFTHNYTTINCNGTDIQVVRTQKTGNYAYVVATPTIKELQQKYADGLPYKMSDSTYNRKIKELFELAGLTDDETFSVDVAGVMKETKARLCDVISSHWARHTFITMKRKEGWKKDILMYSTAHMQQGQTIDHYTHMTREEIANVVANEYLRVANQGNETTHNDTSVNALIGECKDVLMFLGAQYKDIADINDIDTLLYKCYVEYPQPFAQWGIDVRAIKDIYNQKATFEQRTFALKELLRECKEKEVTRA